MHHPGLRALVLALVVVGFFATPAAADIVDLTNGIRLPKKRDIKSPHGVFPTDDELRESGRNNLDLAYDAFEISGQPGDPAQIQKVYVTNALIGSVEFQAGEQNGVRGYWKEAAQAFETAAANLTDAAQQVALYKAMLAAANTGNAPFTMRVADKLLAANPKTYYFGPAQETRARIFATNGRLGDAVAALKQVTDAPGMNVRDYFSAAYMSTWLTRFIRASSAADYAAAETEFKGLLTELERHPRRQLATVPKLKIMMSLAASIRAQGRADEAKALFDQILKETTGTTDKGVLAGVYYGLGDVAFEEASAISEDASKQDQVRELLDSAALHYLRVILLYRDFAGQRELFGSTQGAARVFSQLFTMSGEKDCELARRSYEYYRQAVSMQPAGEAKRLLVREGKALKKKLDEACGGSGEEDIPDEEDEGEE